MGSGNWIVDNLNSALATWNEKLTEIWTLISTSPEEFKGGGIWDVILNIHDALRAIGYALLVLFFVAGVSRPAAALRNSSARRWRSRPLCGSRWRRGPSPTAWS